MTNTNYTSHTDITLNTTEQQYMQTRVLGASRRTIVHTFNQRGNNRRVRVISQLFKSVITKLLFFKTSG